MKARDLAAMARRRRALSALHRVHVAVATDLMTQPRDRKAPSPLASRPRSRPPTRAA